MSFTHATRTLFRLSVPAMAYKNSTTPATLHVHDPARKHIVASSYMIPHPEKAAKGGEDAFFITENSFGVADGVGGWADVGVDPAKYSRKLMYGCMNYVNKHNKTDLDPVQIMQSGYKHAKDQIGSSTACVATTVKNSTGDNSVYLHVANLGDSGFQVFNEEGELVVMSEAQTHGFNFPLQLGTQSGTSPEDSGLYYVKLSRGDVFVMGTDGLFDNLFAAEIGKVIKDNIRTKELTSEEHATHLANCIAETAFYKANDPVSVTPFAQEAMTNNIYFPGGKLDDITVIVAQVCTDEDIKSNL